MKLYECDIIDLDDVFVCECENDKTEQFIKQQI